MERQAPPPNGSMATAPPEGTWRSSPWRRSLGAADRGLERLGRLTTRAIRAFDQRIVFLGRTLIALVRLLLGRTRHLDLRFFQTWQQAGVETLPVVALFATAAGAVLSMLATQQLDRFGVPLLAPKLVGIVILRELGALMTGIALAGRVSSAFCAEIATARTDDEAARAAGVDPVDALVAPRVLALTLSGPLLVAYANALGLLGATAVGAGLMGFPAREHLESMVSALSLKHAISGLVKGTIFGFVAGIAGCYHGTYGGTGSAALGRSVRRAVVGAVVAVAVADVALVFIFKWIRL